MAKCRLYKANKVYSGGGMVWYVDLKCGDRPLVTGFGKTRKAAMAAARRNAR